MKFKIKRNDTVKVMVGKEKGRTGKVRQVLRDTNQVLVEGCNMITKHVKANSDGPGRKFTKEAPLHISNVALWDSEEQRVVKVGLLRKADEDGKCRILRIDKKTKQPID
jgi:large subunit ribosomal protein L24